MSAPAVPDLVPARMVNAYTYCPRLFYLEWVQSSFTDNTDTVDGRYQHRVVDREGGAAPLPEDGELRAARSVMLSSARLGLVARVDLLEGSGSVVTPVDYKRGRPPDNPERSWEPERVQLCVQGLLLRDAGYQCDQGVLYFAETRQRVVVPFDGALIARTHELLAELRGVAARDLPPPPLVDSPKCPRCSLVGICLPDETNTLLARQEAPSRRLLPRDPAARPLYVSEQGVTVGVRAGRVEVSRKGEKLHTARLLDVSQLCVYGNAQVTTQLLGALFAREIPTCWFSAGGWFRGIAHGLPAKHVELRRRQTAVAHQGGLEIARQIVAGKVANSRTLLRRNSRAPDEDTLDSLKGLAEQALTTASIESLLGVEGTAARLYFGRFPAMLGGHDLPGQPFAFDGRNRRPPLDPVNCLLSYLYALLVKDLTVVANIIGFDPYLGFYHRPRFGRPALALDLAEEFRPLVGDSVVVQLINNREVRPSDFIVRAGGVALTPDGRKAVLAAYERRLETHLRHPLFGYRITYRRLLEVQARILAAHVLGEIPAYVPIRTR